MKNKDNSILMHNTAALLTLWHKKYLQQSSSLNTMNCFFIVFFNYLLLYFATCWRKTLTNLTEKTTWTTATTKVAAKICPVLYIRTFYYVAADISLLLIFSFFDKTINLKRLLHRVLYINHTYVYLLRKEIK